MLFSASECAVEEFEVVYTCDMQVYVTGEMLHWIMWEAVRRLEEINLRVCTWSVGVSTVMLYIVGDPLCL